MARPKIHKSGSAAVKADRLLRQSFSHLHEAISDWLDGGDTDAVDVALDAIVQLPNHYPSEPIDEGMPRDERIVILGKRLVMASHHATRLARELRAAEKYQREIRDRIFATIAEPADVPEYVVKLWKQLRAVGATQIDLQPQSRALAEAMLAAARAHNESRRFGAWQEEDADEPIVSWADLPDEFAGFRLREIDPDKSRGFGICPLPPSTEIADFTADGQRPSVGTKRQTITEWTEVITAWCTRNGKTLTQMEAAVWAMLLAQHRLPNDDSRVNNLHGMEIQSPWRPDGIVVVQCMPPPKPASGHEDDDEDDVPY